MTAGELELDELEQAASTGPATAAMPPAVSRRRRPRPALTGAEVLVVAIETEVPLSLIVQTARHSARIQPTLRLGNFRHVMGKCRGCYVAS